MNTVLKVVHYLNWAWVMLASMFTYFVMVTATKIGMADMMMGLTLVIMNYCFARGYDHVFAKSLKEYEK